MIMGSGRIGDQNRAMELLVPDATLRRPFFFLFKAYSIKGLGLGVISSTYIFLGKYGKSAHVEI